MFGMTKASVRTREGHEAAIRLEALEPRDLATGGLGGTLSLAAPTRPPTIGLLLPAVQPVREAAAR